MKRILSLLLAVCMIASLAACIDLDPTPVAPDASEQPDAAETVNPDEDVIVIIDVDPSEWETADSPALTDAAMDVFQKGFSMLLGVNYIPVAYLGKQVVSGTVHTFLTRARVVYPGARETY
ncbi:MAG: hypothetical protein IKF65_09295, partial [Clostridia bacterium]|nr:hypothetical protein [Clostridia bacterium]